MSVQGIMCCCCCETPAAAGVYLVVCLLACIATKAHSGPAPEHHQYNVLRQATVRTPCAQSFTARFQWTLCKRQHLMQTSGHLRTCDLLSLCIPRPTCFQRQRCQAWHVHVRSRCTAWRNSNAHVGTHVDLTRLWILNSSSLANCLLCLNLTQRCF